MYVLSLASCALLYGFALEKRLDGVNRNLVFWVAAFDQRPVAQIVGAGQKRRWHEPFHL